MPPSAKDKRATKDTKPPQAKKPLQAEQPATPPPKTRQLSRSELIKKQRKKKLVAYRKAACAVGYNDATVANKLHNVKSIVTLSDAKRLTRFVPSTPGASTFDKDEFQKRHALSIKPVPDAVARESQVRCDAVMRRAIDAVVMSAIEGGKKTITASMMQSYLRPYAALTMFTSVVPPLGLLRHAQETGIVAVTEADTAASGNDDDTSAHNLRLAEESQKQRTALAAERKAARNGN